MSNPIRLMMFLALVMSPVTAVLGGGGLSEALSSSDPGKRQGALRSILDKSPETSLDVPALTIRSCLYDEDLSVRLAAIAVLVHRKLPDFNADLKILLVRGVAALRSSCAHALGRLGTKETCTLELWRSLEDADESVRREAVASIDLLHGTRMGFMWDQDPREYRRKAQEALREHLQIPAGEDSSHAKKGS